MVSLFCFCSSVLPRTEQSYKRSFTIRISCWWRGRMVMHLPHKEYHVGSIPAVTTKQTLHSVSSIGRALHCHCRGNGIETRTLCKVCLKSHLSGCNVSLVDGPLWKWEDAGSNPACQTNEIYFTPCRLLGNGHHPFKVTSLRLGFESPMVYQFNSGVAEMD